MANAWGKYGSDCLGFQSWIIIIQCRMYSGYDYTRGNYLWQSYCRLLLPWLGAPYWFIFAIWGLKIIGMAGNWWVHNLRSKLPVRYLWPLGHGNLMMWLNFICGFVVRDGPWPDPTWAYFWPAVNKRLTHLWPDPKRFFLTRREKIEKFDSFRGNFPNSNPNHKWLPDPTQATKNWPDLTRVKNFDPDPSLDFVQSVYCLKTCLDIFLSFNFYGSYLEKILGWELNTPALGFRTAKVIVLSKQKWKVIVAINLGRKSLCSFLWIWFITGIDKVYLLFLLNLFQFSKVFIVSMIRSQQKLLFRSCCCRGSWACHA